MNSSNRRSGLWALCAPLVCLAACGGAPRVHVTSQPETARIYVNGTLAGSTPADVVLPFGEGEKVYLQVVHPKGKVVGTQIYTEESLPASGEVPFDLR